MTHYIVVYDDGEAVCAPMGWDTDCDGAVCATSGPIALFADRRAARRAIRISTAYAKLRREQCMPANGDFSIDGSRCVKVLPCALKA